MASKSTKTKSDRQESKQSVSPHMETKATDDNDEVMRRRAQLFKFGGDAVRTPEEKLTMMTRSLQEVLGEDKLKELLASGRPIRLYWGTATTGAPHIGYFVPMTKIADFLRAGCEVIILFADLHAFLDNMKAPWDLLKKRTEYYKEVIQAMLRAVGVPLEKLKFIRGTDYQLSRQYTLDMYKLSSLVTTSYAKKAGAEVVKQVENPLLSGLLYPLLQALDEEYLRVDAQFGGVDQRKIFTFAETFMPKIGYEKRIHLMNPMVPGLNAQKMSSSVVSSKIDLLEDPEVVRQKVMDAFCEEGNIENNGVLSFVKMVLFPICGGKFIVEREKRFGGDVTFTSYQELEDAFKSKSLFPKDLKLAVITYLNLLLEPIRRHFASPDMKKIRTDAYPTENKTEAASEAPAAAPEEPDSPSAASNGDKKTSPKISKMSSSSNDAGASASASAAKNVKGAKKGESKGDLDISAADVRVAKITEVTQHPEDEHLYVVTLDIGNAKRTAAAALVGKIALEVGQLVVAVTNIQPYDRKGVNTDAFILGATDQEGKAAELLLPPEDCDVGERIVFDGYAPQTPMPELNQKKKKEFDKIRDGMSISETCIAMYKDVEFTTTLGPVRVKSLKNGTVR